MEQVLRLRLHLFPHTERAALRVAGFRAMWLGASVSLIGSQVSILALPTLLVLSLGTGALEVSLVGAAQYCALVLAMVRAGVVADRRDPRRVMVLSDAARALALLFIVIVTSFGHVSALQVILVALVVGAGQAFFNTVYSAVLPRLLDAQGLIAGNSLFAQSQYFAIFVWPPLAVLLIHLIGGGMAVAVDAATFVFSGACVLRLGERALPAVVRSQPKVGTQSMESDRISAVRFVWRTTELRLVALTAATGNLGNMMVQGIYLVFVYRTLHLSADFVGIAFGAAGIAGIFGARLAGPAMRRLGTGPALLVSTVLAGASWLAVFTPGVPPFVAGGIAATVISLTIPLFGVVQAALRQKITPAELQGRAAAGVGFISLSSVPIGFLTGGLIGEFAAPRYAILAGSLVAMSSGTWCVPLLSRLHRAGKSDAENAALAGESVV